LVSPLGEPKEKDCPTDDIFLSSIFVALYSSVRVDCEESSVTGYKRRGDVPA
jgi:hypothetical protein